MLSKKEEEYRDLYENAVIGLYRTRISDGKLLKANKTALKMFGYSSLDEAINDDFSIESLYPIEERRKILSSLLAENNSGSFEIHFTYKTGKEIDAAITAKSYEDKNYIECSILDITEKKRSEFELQKKEEQLVQAQKMETVGNLAGGLAHDFNNVLGGIIGTVSLMEYSLNNEKYSLDSLHRQIATIRNSADRAADMVKQLLSLSKKHDLVMVSIDLNESIKNVMKICLNSFEKSIELKTSYYNEKALIKGDPTQIEQIILNLCVNAAHAMTIMRSKNQIQGGELGVSLTRIKSDKHLCKIYPDAEEIPYWLIKISDTGVGMSKEILSKIFDPFFTTKSKGTGLGLAMVYNIIQQHKGFIEVYSEPNIGTSFNIFLPVMNIEETSKDNNNKSDVGLIKGNGLILVVDDEEIMRETIKSILSECGYEVILAENGIEGVKIFNQKSEIINLVILDMAMPKMSGKDAYIEMKKTNPNLKVLMASGYKQDERVQESLNLGVNAFLQKPFAINELSKIVKELTFENNKNV